MTSFNSVCRPRRTPLSKNSWSVSLVVILPSRASERCRSPRLRWSVSARREPPRHLSMSPRELRQGEDVARRGHPPCTARATRATPSLVRDGSRRPPDGRMRVPAPDQTEQEPDGPCEADGDVIESLVDLRNRCHRPVSLFDLRLRDLPYRFPRA